MLSQLLSALSLSRVARRKDAPVLLNIGTKVQSNAGSLSLVPGIARERSGITFPVDAVAPAGRPIWTESLADSLNRRFKRRILVLPEREKPVANAMVDFIKQKGLDGFDIVRAGSRCHPLIDAVHVAFSEHRPLTISPDSIWLVIAQGFGHHVAENSEALRHRLVRHQGKRELVTKVDDLSLSSFEGAIAGFSSQIREASDPVLHETLVCDFSTTTPAIRTASEVALMDCFSSYFSYQMHCICGIPKIALEGSLDDWQRIRARAEVIETYGLGWWVSRLRAILDEFVLTAGGHPTPEFWKAIYKPEQAYGGDAATGWITDLFPYLGDAPGRRRNPAFEQDRHDWALPVRKGVQPASFPSGLSSVPVKVEFTNGSSCDVDLVAGFFAMEQDTSDLALSPVIGWSVAESRPPAPPKPNAPEEPSKTPFTDFFKQRHGDS
jgi:hypothetical protein